MLAQKLSAKVFSSFLMLLALTVNHHRRQAAEPLSPCCHCRKRACSCSGAADMRSPAPPSSLLSTRPHKMSKTFPWLHAGQAEYDGQCACKVQGQRHSVCSSANRHPVCCIRPVAAGEGQRWAGSRNTPGLRVGTDSIAHRGCQKCTEHHVATEHGRHIMSMVN